MKNTPKIVFLMAAMALVGCGGGGGANDGSAGSGSYLAVTGVKSVTGSPVTTVCLNNAANVSANDAKSEAAAAILARFYYITGNYQITSSNYQSCDALPGAISVSVDYYNNTILPWSSANPVSSGAPSGSGPASSSGDANTTNVWIDGNGSKLLTSSNTGTQVYKSLNDNVLSFDGATLLSGLTISEANIIKNGIIIGYADNYHWLYCLDKNRMIITVGANKWSESCTSSGGNSSPTGGDSNSTSNPGPTEPATKTYITWANNLNGTYVQDASGDFFQFNQATRCLYSVNTGQKYNNACLNSTGYGYIGTFDGTAVHIVAAKSSTGIGCVAVFADANYYAVDLYTSGSNEYFRSTDETWPPCGS